MMLKLEKRGSGEARIDMRLNDKIPRRGFQG